MRTRGGRYRSVGELRLNLTALVDVTILVLTFFMVVNQFASAERVEMEIPEPHQSVARDKRLPDTVVVNVLDRGTDRPPAYQIGPLPIETLDALRAELQQARRASPQLEVVLRADRRLPYGRVREVMTLLGEQEISRFHVVAKEQTP